MIHIYQFINLELKLVYIGQTVNIKNRFKSHKSNASFPNRKRKANKLNKAFWEFGFDSFSFSSVKDVSSQDEADNYERELIQSFKDSGFNILNTQPGGRKYYNIHNTDTHKQCYKCKQMFENAEFKELGKNNICKSCERERCRIKNSKFKTLTS